jgi:nucleoside-diphosphate-sugar epimerase
MADQGEIHVVFGGSGALGSAVVRELVKRGKRVRAASRSGKAGLPQEAEVIKADASQPESARQACQGASVVYNCVNVPYNKWPELFPPVLEAIIEGAAAAGAKLVQADNLYMYGPVDGPLTEDLPYRATGRKGKTRARMAERLMAAHEEGKVRVVIGRASDFFGPGVLLSAAGAQVFGTALQGKKAQVLGKLDVPHTYSFVPDCAKAFVTLGERDEALGGVWHVPNAETVTTRQFLQMIFDEAGRTPKIQAAPGFLVKVMGLVNPMMREFTEMLYEYEKPFIVDDRKFRSAFGAEVTPLREAVRMTLDWYRQIPSRS